MITINILKIVLKIKKKNGINKKQLIFSTERMSHVETVTLVMTFSLWVSFIKIHFMKYCTNFIDIKGQMLYVIIIFL